MRNRHCCVAVPPPSTVLVRPHGRCQRRTARPTGSESQTPAVAAVRRGGAHSPGSEGTWGALAGGGGLGAGVPSPPVVSDSHLIGLLHLWIFIDLHCLGPKSSKKDNVFVSISNGDMFPVSP